MISKTTKKFWKLFEKLPVGVQFRAVLAYKKWRDDPYQQELHFKRVGQRMPVYSVRVAYSWRAVGLLEGDTIKWFWVGSHADYEKLISNI